MSIVYKENKNTARSKKRRLDPQKVFHDNRKRRIRKLMNKHDCSIEIASAMDKEKHKYR
jgi:hypothetical protein